MAIEWEAIAKQVGDRTNEGIGVGTDTGRRALEMIIGEENIREAVDYFLSDRPGCFTAEMVLKIISPKSAMNRCYEIYKTTQDHERANNAVFLLGSFADAQALPWIAEFLADTRSTDSRPIIRWNGLRVLSTILAGGLSDADTAVVRDLLSKAELDSDPETRERAKKIRLRLR
jgi:hypothetical protein